MVTPSWFDYVWVPATRHCAPHLGAVRRSVSSTHVSYKSSILQVVKSLPYMPIFEISSQNNDRSIADCISVCRKAINIGQKLVEKAPLSLKYTQLIGSHTTECCQNIICVYYHHMKISTHATPRPLTKCARTNESVRGIC